MYYYQQEKTRQEQVEEREQEVLNIIIKLLNKGKGSPSVREIRRECRSISSLSTIHTYLKRLQRKGIIDWDPNVCKTLHLVQSEKRGSAR